jgi:AraC-like DNA-binding protein
MRYIECYWYADTNGASLFNDREIYFPDPRAELYFNLGEPYVSTESGEIRDEIHLWAPRRNASELSGLHGARLLVVRFTPLGLSHFFGIAGETHSGDSVSFKDILPNDYARLWDRVQNKSFFAASNELDLYFNSLLKDESIEQKRAAGLYTALITSNDKNISTTISRLGYSYKTAQRHCRKHFGMNPKELQGLAKLNRALNYFKAGISDIEEVAYLSGYYDSSDFSGRFGEAVGAKPGDILKSPGLIMKALHPLLRPI